jgi:thiosulfate/3-mercaptopyruvate sulfurtransferase
MKKNNISPIISPEALLGILHKRNLRLIDARVGEHIKTVFKKEHLTKAQHVDLEQDMADIKPNAADGGRHPLPDIQQFAALLGRLGISPQAHIVVYDDKNGSNAAARFWWMMRAMGHDNIQVLDGGYQAALRYKIPTTQKIQKYKAKPPYPTEKWQLSLSNMTEVARVANDDAYTVIDVRDAARYRGEVEPIDLIAGHIPGAINIPFSNNLDAEGNFQDKTVLKTLYASHFADKKAEQIIVHCGSGVTACHTLLAMAQAGFDIPKLYVGSWSEWSRNDMPIGRG